MRSALHAPARSARRRSSCPVSPASLCRCSSAPAALTRRAAAALALAAPLLAALPARADAGPRLVDRSRALSASRAAALEAKLAALEEATGFRLRVFIADGCLEGGARREGEPGSTRVSRVELRGLWGAADARTLYVLADPTQRSVLEFLPAAEVRAALRGQFLAELSGRYGSMFFVRDEGVAESVSRSINVLDTCLRKGGCSVVPGVAEEGAWLTQAPSAFAGAVLGYSLRQNAPGSSPLSNALALAPFWAFLLLSFGILPVWARSEGDPLALAPNLLSFAAGVGLLYLTPILGAPPGLGAPGEGDDVGKP